MATTLYAQPYDITAKGFFFETAEDFACQAAAKRNRYGLPVEEFAIQFIDGARVDAALTSAFGLHQCDVAAFFEKVETWDDAQKLRAIIATRECGYVSSLETCDPDGFDLDICEEASLRDLAEQFVEDGLFGDIPEWLQVYIDYDAITRDLTVEHSETVIAGRRLVYRCG